jgi:hypothetical protein
VPRKGKSYTERVPSGKAILVRLQGLNVGLTDFLRRKERRRTAEIETLRDGITWGMYTMARSANQFLIRRGGWLRSDAREKPSAFRSSVNEGAAAVVRENRVKRRTRAKRG